MRDILLELKGCASVEVALCVKSGWSVVVMNEGLSEDIKNNNDNNRVEGNDEVKAC